MSFHFLLFSTLLTSISAQTSLFEGSSKSSLPYYSSVPLTDFRCENQQFAGYYSDPEADCQVFHICIRRQEKLEQFSFLCPNETVFHQQLLVCVWWDGFECSSAPSLYYLNENIFEDHGTNIDLEAHVAFSQGKSLIPDDKIIPSSHTKVPVSVGKALLPLVKPSPEGRNLDLGNELKSKVSEDYSNQITRRPEVKPSRPTYLPRRTSKIQYSDVENQNTLKTEEITNPDLQLLSSPFSENLISNTSSVIKNKKTVQTSTQTSVSKVKIIEKPKDASKSSFSISGTTLPNNNQKVKETGSGAKLLQSNSPVPSLKQEIRKSNSNVGARRITTGNDKSNPRLVKTITKLSQEQKGKAAKAIQSPFPRVQSTISSRFNLKESTLRQNETLLSTPEDAENNNVPVKISSKTTEKTTTTNVKKIPFTRVESTVSTGLTSQTSPRQNNVAISTPINEKKNSFSRVQSTVSTRPISQTSPRQNNVALSTPINAIKNPFSRVQSTVSRRPTSRTSPRQNNAALPTPTNAIKNPFSRIQSTISTGPTFQSSPRQNNAALPTPNNLRDNNIEPRVKSSSRVKPKAPKLLQTTAAAPLSTSRNTLTPVSPNVNTIQQFQRKPLKSTAQRGQQRPPFKSRSKTTPNRNLSKGLTSYDILHDLLKNVTILRSKTLLKSNSDSRRRNIRQNNIQKPLEKSSSSKFYSSGAESSSPKQKTDKSGTKNYSGINKKIKSSDYLPTVSQGGSKFGNKLKSNPTKVSSLNDTPQGSSSTTTNTFVPTLPPTEDTRKKTTQKKGYLNVSNKSKNIPVKNFQDFLNLDLPLKSNLPSSQPSLASSFPSLSSSSHYEDPISLISSSIYETSSTPKNGLYK